ncbi:MAG: GtrA family protein, partial [Polyangiaceae bacterium]
QPQPAAPEIPAATPAEPEAPAEPELAETEAAPAEDVEEDMAETEPAPVPGPAPDVAQVPDSGGVATVDGGDSQFFTPVETFQDRAEGVGVSASVGLMARPERVVVLGSAMALSPIVDAVITLGPSWPPFMLTVVALGFVALATQLTALYRLHHTMTQLSGGPAENVKRHLVGTALSSALATAVDFGVVLLLVEVGGMTPWLATGLAAMSGAFVNFMVNRIVVFGSNDPAAPQAFRYSVVSASGAMLNAGGVAAMMLQPMIDYKVSWWIVRGAVFLLWSFPLQRNYVYAPQEESEDDVEATSRDALSRPVPRSVNTHDSQDEASV